VTGLLGLQYECPNLVELPMEGSNDTMWLMAISINPGAPLGGSTTEYFPGSFNGTHFEAVDAATRLLDFSKDNYAGQFFYGIPGNEPQVFMAWASNWEYTNAVPSGPLEGWRSSMTVARQAYLANVTRTGYALINKPYNMTPIYEEQLGNSTNLGNSSLTIDYSSLYSGAVYFSANVTNLPNTSLSQGTLNFTFSCSYTKESISGGFYFGGDNPFWLTRGDIKGFDNPFFTDKFSVGVPLNRNGTFQLEGIIDRSIAEIFLDRGRNGATMTFFPTGMLDTMDIRASGLNEGVEIAVEVWGLKSTWQGQEDDEGIVLGNVTESSGGNSTQMMRRDVRMRRSIRLA
jgi:beta-fructofuranosidase